VVIPAVEVEPEVELDVDAEPEVEVDADPDVVVELDADPDVVVVGTNGLATEPQW